MIPKKIHYCWLGSKNLPQLAEKCIASWKKYCPDYEIILWNENNYDFTKHPYMKQALDAKKWGFVPDYARLDIVYQHGGIYLDTDVELVKNLDSLLEYDFYAGFESEKFVAFGLGFGAIPGHPLLKEMMDDYDNYSFIKDNGELNLLPSPVIQTELLIKYGLQPDSGKKQVVAGTTIFPSRFFSPKNGILNRYNISHDTYSIHHYAASWMSIGGKLRASLSKIIGYENYNALKRVFFKK